MKWLSAGKMMMLRVLSGSSGPKRQTCDPESGRLMTASWAARSALVPFPKAHVRGTNVGVAAPGVEVGPVLVGVGVETGGGVFVAVAVAAAGGVFVAVAVAAGGSVFVGVGPEPIGVKVLVDVPVGVGSGTKVKVLVGVAAALVLPSYVLLSDAAVTVIGIVV